MKALILAAGFGTRLLPLTEKLPKCLVPVNGKPILFKQIDNLYENDITDITIISGYMADVLKEQTLRKYPKVKIIESVDYATTNNMYSAYLGIKNIGICDTLMMNADVFFDSSVIKSLLEDSHKNAVVVDIGRYLEESMKVIEKEGILTEISKTISKEDALGSSIDVYKFDRHGLEVFYNRCRNYIEEQKEVKKWSEVALNDAFRDANFYACPLNGRWFEIDNFDDLRIAEEIFK